MLAEAVDLDVLDDHHAVRFLREYRTVDQLVLIDAIARRKEGERRGDPVRRLDQSFALGILADLAQQLVDERCDLSRVDLHGNVLKVRCNRRWWTPSGSLTRSPPKDYASFLPCARSSALIVTHP